MTQRVASLHWMMWPAVAFVAVMVIFPFGYAFWLSLLDYKIGQSDAFIGAGQLPARCGTTRSSGTG
jgi:ABC-type sugar transport system permease subunit